MGDELPPANIAATTAAAKMRMNAAAITARLTFTRNQTAA
jgi:hypothetical protein